MGINYTTAALLTKAKRNHACFDDILTIGHLTLYLSRSDLARLARRCGLTINLSDFPEKSYADKFFEVFLDAKRVKSLDYSDYQGSPIIHDMNRPVDPIYHDRFDAVIDGGSIEHVFNFPVAMANCMNMVKKGGSLYIFTTANNYTGHGFYQFSPELFFRIFQPENGFEIQNVILEEHAYPGAELSPETHCYTVRDPAELKSRIGLVTKSPVLIMAHAIRREIVPVFARFPIQSDYASESSSASQAQTRGQTLSAFRRLLRSGFQRLPSRCRNFINGQRQLHAYSFSNSRFYRRWDPDA